MALVLACLAALSSSACSRVSAVAGLRELPGATIVTGGLVALVTGLSQAPAWGWTATTTLAFLATGVALLVGFAAVESRAEHPLVPMGLLCVRTVAAGDAIMVLTGAALLGVFHFLSLYVQVILHYGALGLPATRQVNGMNSPDRGCGLRNRVRTAMSWADRQAFPGLSPWATITGRSAHPDPASSSSCREARIVMRRAQENQGL